MNLSVGRGHPFYLEGILEALIRRGALSLVRRRADVFDETTGLSLLGWKTARWLYRAGSSIGAVSKIYERIRKMNDYNQPSLAQKLLGYQLKASFGRESTPLLVSHPALVGILAGNQNLIYQHGELVAPRESLVRGASLVCVPTENVAEQFKSIGYNSNQILVTNLCVEHDLVKIAEESFRMRRIRIESGGPLCGAFFSSGAEPSFHVHSLVHAALSVVRSGSRVIIFAKEEGKLAGKTKEAFARGEHALHTISVESPIPVEFPPALLMTFRSHREENILTALAFDKFDFFVAPAHERVNWAMGLGLPMFALTPTIGSYAPLNLELVERSGVAVRLAGDSEIVPFAIMLESVRASGQLLQMTTQGWGRHPISGFDTIARHFISQS